MVTNSILTACFKFSTGTAEELWAGVVGVSNSGKKKGRGKRVGRKRVTNLNKGQVLGSGTQHFFNWTFLQ